MEKYYKSTCNLKNVSRKHNRIMKLRNLFFIISMIFSMGCAAQAAGGTGDVSLVGIGSGGSSSISNSSPNSHSTDSSAADTVPVNTAPVNTASADTTYTDTSYADTASANAGYTDTNYADTASADAGYADTASADTGYADAGYADTASADAGYADTNYADTASADTGYADTASADAGYADTASADAGYADTNYADTASADTGYADTNYADTASADTASADNTASAEMPDESWALILVNRTHPIPDDYQIGALTELANSHRIDSRVYPALQQMFDDARAQGIYPMITSSFRTYEEQQRLMDDKIQEYIYAGYSEEDAKALAEEWVAIPGTSEHQLGLSLDISADESQGYDPGTVWYWLEQNSYLYGFIRRYPEEKKDITGIINEPWHFRYVGKKAALEMHESGQCLEEYLGL